MAAMKRPAVSIVLPFYNAEATLAEALDTIAAQTLEAYELIAVDDGSEDSSARLVRERARGDPRIRLLQPGRGGVVGAMNAGAAAAGAPLIARMHADDRMHPERLAQQVRFLVRHPEVDLVGTQVRLFPKERIAGGFASYIAWQNGCLHPATIADEVYVELPIANPSIMYRRAPIAAAGGYRDGPFPEDYELLLRLVHAGRRLAKVPQVLLDWRDGPGRLTRTDPRYSRAAFDRVRAAYLACDRRLKGRPIVIWGAGRKTRRRAELLFAHGPVPSAWIDIDPRKLGRTFHGAPVVTPQWLERPAAAAPPFVLAYVNNRGAREAIAAYLAERGFRRGRDYLMVG